MATTVFGSALQMVHVPQWICWKQLSTSSQERFVEEKIEGQKGKMKTKMRVAWLVIEAINRGIRHCRE
jgi:hypothetical protein